MLSVPAHVLENGQIISVFSFKVSALVDLEKMGIINVPIPERGSVRCIISDIDPAGRFIEFVTVPSWVKNKRKVVQVDHTEYCPFFTPLP